MEDFFIITGYAHRRYLVGSAGTILTILMCKAMNRSLLNVIAGALEEAVRERKRWELLRRSLFQMQLFF